MFSINYASHLKWKNLRLECKNLEWGLLQNNAFIWEHPTFCFSWYCVDHVATQLIIAEYLSVKTIAFFHFFYYHANMHLKWNWYRCIKLISFLDYMRLWWLYFFWYPFFYTITWNISLNIIPHPVIENKLEIRKN